MRALALLSLTIGTAWAVTETWPIDDEADYDFDPSEVTVADGAATLIATVSGTGADGDLALSGQTWNLSTDASGTRSYADGIAWTVSGSYAAAETSITLDGYAGGLAADDELLLLIVQGDTSTYADAGTYELVRVLAVDSAGVVSLGGLSNAYDGASYAIIAQRVPNYGDVTLVSSTITADGWDGSTGGVVAFRAAGTVSVDVDSAVSADGLGYRGGAGGTASGGGSQGGETYVGVDGNGGADGANGSGSGGGGEGTSNSVGTEGGPGGFGAGGGGTDGTDNSDDGAGGGGGGSYAGGGGGGGGGTGCGGSAAGRGGAGGAGRDRRGRRRSELPARAAREATRRNDGAARAAAATRAPGRWPGPRAPGPRAAAAGTPAARPTAAAAAAAAASTATRT
ncbi:MAG: hypothetical protein H6741_29535 [Alphaproteobacteria bacterium]|nr:hypothetical protein [Alphaproteobacteria bacterium]